jgi:DNA repair protein RadC
VTFRELPALENLDESALWLELAARHPAGESIVTTMSAVMALRPYLAGREQEHLYAILVNARMVPLGVPRLIAVGTINSVEAKPRDIFRDAIRENALGIFLAHNHPSNQPSPSQADIDFTEVVCLFGQLLGIPVFDSLVVTDHGFTSIVDLLNRKEAIPTKALTDQLTSARNYLQGRNLL